MAQLLADAVMAPGRNGAFDAVLKWVLLMALIAVAAVVSYDYGLLNYLFGADKSKITAPQPLKPDVPIPALPYVPK